jgi:hypothetical protein
MAGDSHRHRAERGPGWHGLTIGEKQRQAVARQRETPVACPSCEAWLMPDDLLGHLERCPGPEEPHRASRWLSRDRVRALGVSTRTVSTWLRRGLIRRRGDLLLERDLVRVAAWSRLLRGRR